MQAIRLLAIPLLIAFSTTQAFAGAPVTRRDVSCAVSDSTRAARSRFIDGEIQNLEKSIGDARRFEAVIVDALHAMRSAYTAADIADTISTAASIVAGGAMIKQLLTRGAVSVFGMTLLTRATFTSVGIRTAIAGGGTYIVFKNKDLTTEEIRAPFFGKEIQAKSIDEILEAQYQHSLTFPLIPEGMPLLADPVCTGFECPVLNPQLERIRETLDQWHDANERRIAELDGWYRPEWITHLYGESLEKVELPYARNALRILELKADYLRALRATMELDRRACSGTSSTCRL